MRPASPHLPPRGAPFPPNKWLLIVEPSLRALAPHSTGTSYALLISAVRVGGWGGAVSDCLCLVAALPRPRRLFLHISKLGHISKMSILTKIYPHRSVPIHTLSVPFQWKRKSAAARLDRSSLLQRNRFVRSSAPMTHLSVLFSRIARAFLSACLYLFPRPSCTSRCTYNHWHCIITQFSISHPHTSESMALYIALIQVFFALS